MISATRLLRSPVADITSSLMDKIIYKSTHDITSIYLNYFLVNDKVCETCCIYKALSCGTVWSEIDFHYLNINNNSLCIVFNIKIYNYNTSRVSRDSVILTANKQSYKLWWTKMEQSVSVIQNSKVHTPKKWLSCVMFVSHFQVTSKSKI